MAADITCNVCGGTDFLIEAGHYYCNECQTQTQDIREQVFDVPEDITASRRTSFRRIRTEKKGEDQLTSWECYNYIILGLVNELIELGADSKLKQNVHVLWFKYLRSLEVISDKPDAVPKLSAVYSQKDVEIIYGRRPKKRRRSSRTPSPSSSSGTATDTTTSRKDRAKQRRSMVLSQYDEYSNTMQSEEVSLHNQSLASLRSGSDTSKDKEKYLQFNHASKKELLKIMTKNHMKSHCRDVNSLLNCHKVTYKMLSNKFVHSANILSRYKLYAIIYLGLLINKDKIQLGDLIRFIREGSLSYHNIRHFFPEEYEDKNLNIKNWNRGNTILSHYSVRETAANIAKQLKITQYVPRQNLVELCQRYCQELNLPDQVLGYTLNFMSRSIPQMHFTMKSKLIPNYEGRVMSIIMFVLKLFLGLDEVTEEKFSAYAESINNLNNEDNDVMFVWRDWAHYIYYRKFVLIQHHFPTKYMFDNDNCDNSNLLVNFLNQHHSIYENDVPLSREAEVLKRLLEKLKNQQQSPSAPSLEFKPTLTPFQDYTQVLIESKILNKNHHLTSILQREFKNSSFQFITNPFGYLEEFNKYVKVGIKHRGANTNFKMIRIPNFKAKRESWRTNANKTVYVKFSRKSATKSAWKSTNHLNESKSTEELKTKEILRNFEYRNMKSYTKNLKRSLKEFESREGLPLTYQRSFQHQLEMSSAQALQNLIQNDQSQMISPESQEQTNYFHYNPHDRHWLKSMNVANINKEEFHNFIKTYPESFQLLLNECARITEQQPKNLFEEFNDVEIYFCYVTEFTRKDKFRDKIVNNDLKRLIEKSKKNW